MKLFMRLFSRPPTIFVQVACYRDPEMQWTVKDLFEKAAHPERIHVGICWQFDEEADKDCFIEPYTRPKQVREIKVPAKESLGVCWARHQAESLYRGEDYILMIDSHMRFVERWDEKMMAQLERCPSEKALLTAYPPGYTPPNNLKPNPKITVQRLKPATDKGDIRGDGKVLEHAPEKPLRGAFLACGFIFASGKLCKEVPYDPHLYFNQEEISLAARYFTHGWDVYHPNEILLYHYYKAPGNKDGIHRLQWEDNKDWSVMQVKARKRLHHLVGHRKTDNPAALVDIEKYGFGKARSLQEFEAFGGVDFKTMQVSEKAQQALFIEGMEAAKPAARIALAPGHFLPPFVLPDSTGKPREIQLYAGKRTWLCFLPKEFPAFTNEFLPAWQQRYEAFKAMNSHLIFVVQGSPDEAQKLKNAAGLEPLFLADEKGTLITALGWQNRIAQEPLSLLINANQKILGTMTGRNAQNHLGDIFRAAAAQPATEQSYLINRMHAPVLLVPEAISQELADEVLKYWETGRQYKGTIGAGKDDAKVVVSGKRRTDVNIEDRALLRRVDEHLAASVLPEIKKVAAFDVAYRDRYKIGCYEAADQGFYNQHRDTGIASLAHRRYSMSLALNDGYEGGYLNFPEYGPVLYQIPKRAALLFPSPLLHSVAPVTEGKRFVMVSFFHGKTEEAYRKEQMLQRGETYNEDDVKLLAEFPDKSLATSAFLYSHT